MFYRFARGLFRLFFNICCQWRIIGGENEPVEGPVIVICNHVGNWDPIVLGVALKRQVRYMAKEELFRWPVLGQLIKSLGAFPIKRGQSDRAAMKTAQEIITQGQMLGMFPEGSRSRTGGLRPFKAGAAVLALRTGATVLPVALVGTQRIFRQGWFRPFQVRIGAPIMVNKPDVVDSAKVEELTARFYTAIENLLSQ